MNTPKSVKLLIAIEVLGIIALIASTFASTAPAYLATLGLGCGCLFIGLLGFVFVMVRTKE